MLRQFSRGWVWLVQLGSGKLGLGKAVYKWCALVMSVWLRYARVRQFGLGTFGFGSFGWSQLRFVKLS